MAEHRTLLSTDVHEPKHITDSTSADAGKVITPSTGGSSELRYLTPSEVGVNFIYGEVALDQNTTSFSIPAATDSSLYTEADYVQLNSARTPAVYLDHANGVTFEGATNSLIPSVSGDYRVHFWMNVKSNTANTKLGVKAKQNGTWCNFTTKTDIKEVDRVQNITGSIITTLTPTNEVSLYVASDKSADITVQDMRFYIELVRGV
ncbi:MAG: hypothetical protein Tp1100MES1331091_23 [Prokaryotic dsDNA virus sp.]|nr:MAG: hypothetical protein Tp1100MES1331091_23 [Prokaryotic dsDNA virus sp.]|tara:strand:- start:1311 stop:1925 length:615 start_codon:yes stop_codon:yes gene_type:complete